MAGADIEATGKPKDLISRIVASAEDAPSPNTRVVKKVRMLKGNGTGSTPRGKRKVAATAALDRRRSVFPLPRKGFLVS